MYAVWEITDSIGLTYYTYEPGVFNYLLRGAIIDGKKYGIITDVDSWKNYYPTKHELSQNYPNPFNPTTVIKYQLSENSFVTLKVYDILGCEVSTLINEYKEAGYYETSFDASSFSSGVYFYKLQAGSLISVKKMLLSK